MTQSTQLRAKSLQEQLLCPVLLEPLTEAVSLVPCAHKMQQVVAEKIFGTTHGGWQVQSKLTCPICRTSVLGYTVDHAMRNIVKKLFELPENDLNAMLASMKNNLAEKCMTVEKGAQLNMPYPGKPARFIHTYGNWDECNLKKIPCRYAKFGSSTQDSLIEYFSLHGYNSGEVKILIKFSNEFSKNMSSKIVLKEYFKQFDIILNYDNFLESKDHDQLKLIFNIIAENNEIPASYFERIKDIVAKGTH